MCENCDTTRAALMQEIRELANGEGELYGKMVEIANESPEDERDSILGTQVAKAIGIRSAFVAQHVNGGDHHGEMPSMILGQWAHFCMVAEAELATEAAELVRGVMREIFGDSLLKNFEGPMN